MNTVENNINLLIAELNKSNLTKEQSLDYLGHVFRTTTKKVVSNSDRSYVALSVDEYLKKARAGDFRYASGFFGNWAKHHEEDQDVGC
jgi:hypothetical protein